MEKSKILHLLVLVDAYIQHPTDEDNKFIQRFKSELSQMAPASLNELRDEATRIATEHGFTDNTPAEDIALFHSEASEALEDIRDGHALTATRYTKKVKLWDLISDMKLPGDTIIKTDNLDMKVEIRAERFNDDGSLNKPCGVPAELADIIIRILHFAGHHGIDIQEAVREKMAYNESRPFRHGGKAL